MYANLDVYSVKSWAFHEDQRRRAEQKAMRKDDDVMSLSSEEEEKAPAPKQFALTLQGPGQKVKIRVAEVFPTFFYIDIRPLQFAQSQMYTEGPLKFPPTRESRSRLMEIPS